MTRSLVAASLLLTASVFAVNPQTPSVQPIATDAPKQRPAERKVSRSLERQPVRATPRRSHRAVEPEQQPTGGVVMAVTMYCPTGSRNAAGNWPSLGTAAANAYPLGTRLEVESVGVVTVEDRSAPGATDVDIFGGSDAGCTQRATAWGRRYLHVRRAA